MMKRTGAWLVVALLGGMGTAVAALQAPVNGQVYDDVLGISWLQDANFVKTSCDANSALWQYFDPEAIANSSGRTKVQICNDSGRLNWYEAEAWIAHLNVNNHLGHNDWRQPATGPVNGSAFNYDYAFDGSKDRGYNISGPGSAFPGSTGSELAYMHYNNLGNKGWQDTAGNDQQAAVCPAPDYCVQNTGPFQDLQSFFYWSGTVYAPFPSSGAWIFRTNDGLQTDGGFLSNYGYVWPVRLGPDTGATPDATPIPVMGGLGVLLLGAGLGLLGLLGFRRRA
jgi:hypothetical protein